MGPILLNSSLSSVFRMLAVFEVCLVPIGNEYAPDVVQSVCRLSSLEVRVITQIIALSDGVLASCPVFEGLTHIFWVLL